MRPRISLSAALSRWRLMPRTATAGILETVRHISGTPPLLAPVRVKLQRPAGDPAPSFDISGAPSVSVGRSASYSAGHFVLEEPESNTVAALSSARCPLCSQTYPIRGLLAHVNDRHKDVPLDKEAVRKVVRARYSLLKAAEKREGVTAPVVPPPGQPAASSPPIASHVTATGFPCRHCEEETPQGPQPLHGLFASVDAVMKHIAVEHPHIDLDEEPIPKKITRTKPAPAASEKPSAPGSKPNADVPKKPLPKLQVPAAPPMNMPPAPTLATVTAAPPAPEKDPVVFTDDQFPCELCRKVFGSEKDLIQHLDSAHADDIAEDDGASGYIDPNAVVANKARPEPTADQQARVAAYIPSTTAPISVVCTLCTKKARVFTTEVALHAHIVQKHDDVDPVATVREMMRAGKAEAFPCPECGKVFLQASALVGHMQSKHPAAAIPAGMEEAVAAAPAPGAPPPEAPSKPPLSGGPWWCNDCNKGFKSGSALTGHLSTKHGLPTQALPCPGCKRVFPDMWALKSHVRQAHRTLDDSLYDDANISYQCDLCPRKFLSSTALAIHQKKMHGR